MGQALEVISGRTTNPGATLTTVTNNTGSSNVIRAAAEGSRISLVTLWNQAATAGEVRITSARIHDQADGIRLRTLAARSYPLAPPGPIQRLYSQDSLTIQTSGGAAETDTVFLLVFYDDLPGVAANLARWSDIAPRIVNLSGVRENAAASATVGDVGQPQVLTADQDTFKRNVNYALLGIISDVTCGLLGLVGADTGNLVVGLPTDIGLGESAYGFAELSALSGLPTIPIINGANVGATSVAACHTTVSQAFNASYLFAELG